MENNPANLKNNSPEQQTSVVTSKNSQQDSATSYATLEPFSPSYRGRGRGGNRGRNNLENRIKLRDQIVLGNLPPADYKKYIMKAHDECNLWKASETIIANRELKRYLKGAPKTVTELKNGSLLIEVTNREQAIKVKQITHLNNINVIVK